MNVMSATLSGEMYCNAFPLRTQSKSGVCTPNLWLSERNSGTVWGLEDPTVAFDIPFDPFMYQLALLVAPMS